MDAYLLHIIESIVVFLAYIILIYITKKATDKAADRYSKSAARVKIIKKIIQFILIAISVSFLLLIWGVKQSELMFFVSSLLTVLGIAFFAQWSIISNITATLIIFFNYPARIGDEIEIFDIDHPVRGRITDIGIFFVTITNNDDALITIPSNLFIQKMVTRKKVERKKLNTHKSTKTS
ncbi:mechanosensitive ion channel domain-containing protein [Brumimicrobium aurantiacum]|uniref:Mechanosensitive ion channel family protein n=1 Tax=Brumimicrobium aurantiacum TaxID=1737063 RepID=A0A3E1F256_9FLAO|nr:mechanosensitive ion channel domain-containing protein [Brumimicrobium aurantiacum]RFC55902.1 mechanosensitive ion channel family protein [Brumimicrobium aurantiacum]